ncbi:tetratricopeptide repeat protein [Ideonella sp. YS5]|uniref:tetratricopeptide repeat protein n=1 Tax=Ideonella sp. YS5 TaxID=3453714 RepID=UPI003EEDE9AB
MQSPRLIACAAGLLAGLSTAPATWATAIPRTHAEAASACWQRLSHGQAAGARSACEAALQLGAGEPADVVRLGHALWMAGEREAALVHYRAVLATGLDGPAWRAGPMRELNSLIARGGAAAAAWREALAWLDASWRALAGARADLAAAAQLAHDKRLDAALPLAQRAFEAVDPVVALDAPARMASVEQLVSLQEQTFRYDEMLAFSRAQLARVAAAGDRDADLKDLYVGAEAVALGGLGRHAESAEAWQRAIETAERIDGAQGAGLVGLLNARADALLEAGQAEAASAVLVRAAGLLGPKATVRVAAETFGLLARCYRLRSQPDDALRAAGNALQLANHIARDEPAAPVLALAELADVQAAQEHYAEAISLNRQALALAESTLGPDHPVTTRRMERFALALAAGGQPVGAMQWLQRSLELAERTLGPRHPETVSRRERLAQWSGSAEEPAADLPHEKAS